MGKSFFGQQFQIFLPISQKQNKTKQMQKYKNKTFFDYRVLLLIFIKQRPFFMFTRSPYRRNGFYIRFPAACQQ